MLDDELEESFHLTSIIEGLSTSPIDTDKLVNTTTTYYHSHIGMNNFRAKKSRNNNNNNNSNSLKSPTHSTKYNVPNQIRISPNESLARQRWKLALKKLKKIEDPWAKFKIADYPEEIVIRHRYNPVRKEWKKDENIVKMEPTQFAKGAMRACFRLKKLSNFSHDTSWEHASNYVAKCYIDSDIPRKRYFEDVKLQMDAKLWAELYNRHNPPKKIDMFQVAIIEFKNRPDSPLYHLEHYIEGDYIKYNSNAGFVEDLHMRLTPHAFSHFTFESSNHELIVVDIQGVGDLYTDPQIHTAFGDEYGEGNLNIKGFALFFYSHICNDVCRSLGLTPFDLAPTELKNHHKIVSHFSQTSDTRSIGKVEPISIDREYEKKRQIIKKFESYDSTNSNDLMEVDEDMMCSSFSPYSPYSSSFSQFYLNRENSNSSKITDLSNVFDERLEDEAYEFFKSKVCRNQRPSAVYAEKKYLLNADTECRKKIQEFSTFDTVLGKIHLEMCKYHEIGRFLNDTDDFCRIDYEAAFFHLNQAANLGEVEALINIAKIYMQLPHDILPEYKIKETDENYATGFEYLIEAAEKDDKQSVYYVAKAYDTGIGLPSNSNIDWSRAVEYYRKIINDSNEDNSDKSNSSFTELGSDCEAIYVILARIGEIYLQGGNGIEVNLQEAMDFFNEAAEKAMQYGKGRLANKYYSLAEKAAALL